MELKEFGIQKGTEIHINRSDQMHGISSGGGGQKSKMNQSTQVKQKYNVLTMLIKDVFPAPFGPSIPKHSPRGTARDSPLTATFGGFPSLPR